MSTVFVEQQSNLIEVLIKLLLGKKKEIIYLYFNSCHAIFWHHGLFILNFPLDVIKILI